MFNPSVSGIHPDVVSSVSVEFLEFDNTTVDSSITLRVENLTGPRFLTHYYRGFIDFLKSSFDPSDVPQMYSIHEVNGGLEMSIAVMKASKGYRSKRNIVEVLRKRMDKLEQLLQSSSITIGYSPCHNPICENQGICSDSIRVFEDTRITDSQSLVFTSPVVSHEFSCQCAEGFTGKTCSQRQDPCSPNPCQAGGTCRKNGLEFQCLCPPLREGKFCELKRNDACYDNPCRNGGSCHESPDLSSYFCLCRPGYRGNQCEITSDSCRPNPCLNGGLCQSLKPGYKCSCPHGMHGRHCDQTSHGFSDLSYLAFPPLDSNTNDIGITFATTKPNALLAYNYGVQTGGRSDFLALELRDGKAVFSYGGARTAITSVTINSESLATGDWHRVTATRNGRVIALSVSTCQDNGDLCQECRAGDATCYAGDIGPAG